MPKKSAGLLLYRQRGGGAEVFLVHPGGPYWSKKDAGSWSIPKGEFGDQEEPLEAARREFREETGLEPAGKYHPLAPIRQAGGKIVVAWAVGGDADAREFKSNTFRMEWPKGSGKMREFAEVDRAEWFPIKAARVKILKSQISLLDELEQFLSAGEHD
jgi:predicted NUDIX family NTP pyrophosphohydrolase